MTRAIWALTGIALAAVAIYWIAALAAPAAFDYAEGDTATWIWLVRHGRALYQAPAGLPLLPSNYPPLQLWLVAALAPTDGAILTAGRLLSFAGLGLAAAAVGGAVRGATGSSRAAWLAALLFGATFRVGYHGMVARGDALALGLGALAVVLATRRGAWPLLAAPLLVAALLTKHNLIVFPVGLTLWALRRRDPRTLAILALAGGALALALARLGLFAPLFLWSQAPWSASNFVAYFASAALPSGIAVAIGLGVWRRRHDLPPRAREAVEPWLYVLLAGVVWTAALGRRGSSSNYVLELCAATTVVAVIAFHHGLYRRLFLGHVALGALESVVWTVLLVGWLIPRANARHVAARAAIAATSGAVLAEETWPATSLGRPPLVVPFLASELARAGYWDPAPLTSALDRGAVPLVLLEFALDAPARAQGHDDRFLPAVQSTLRARYRLTAHPPGLWIYAPTPTTAED